MLKLILALALAVCFVGPVMAEDGNNVLDQFGDILTGHNDAVTTSIAPEIVKELQTASIPGLNLIPGIKDGRTQIGIKTILPIGDGWGERAEVEIPIRIIF